MYTQTTETMKELSAWSFGADREPSGGGETILFVEDEAFVRERPVRFCDPREWKEDAGTARRRESW